MNIIKNLLVLKKVEMINFMTLNTYIFYENTQIRKDIILIFRLIV
jgi:hypothetical protein